MKWEDFELECLGMLHLGYYKSFYVSSSASSGSLVHSTGPYRSDYTS